MLTDCYKPQVISLVHLIDLDQILDHQVSLTLCCFEHLLQESYDLERENFLKNFANDGDCISVLASGAHAFKDISGDIVFMKGFVKKIVVVCFRDRQEGPETEFVEKLRFCDWMVAVFDVFEDGDQVLLRKSFILAEPIGR